MEKIYTDILDGYKRFQDKYHHQDSSIMQMLSSKGQHPKIMVVACCDSRVDPAILLQCDPGELFVVRNVANIIPPYENDEFHHSTSAALEFAICYLNIEHLIILGHSQCGGLEALVNQENLHQNDFITHWTSLAKHKCQSHDIDTVAKSSLSASYDNCLTFPWIKTRVEAKRLRIHRWFFEIKDAKMWAVDEGSGEFKPLEQMLGQ